MSSVAINPAVAADPAPKAEASAGEEKEVDASRYMDVSNLVVPVVRQGVLRNYVYVTVRLMMPEGVNSDGPKEKGHLLRDAMLRASHRADLADPTRDDQINRPLAIETFSRVARETLGAASVGEIQLLWLSSLRRDASPARR
jgi:hypothetical protein